MKQMGMNAVVVQVRPDGRCIYPLHQGPVGMTTGTQGKSPDMILALAGRRGTQA
ncbi:hypothetical protein P7H19_22260 [Paenibacillus larvae]|nr:hypothetical protein [Paenibacillus larvae]MDT2238469.1 hypothetical protein [Paenibacillus larvae]